MTKLGNIREKLFQWNQELKKRRNSQGDSISQWWQWNGSGSRSSTPISSRAAVVRSTSLKSDLNRRGRIEDDDDDEVFVKADTVRTAAISSQVKSAMIVSAANPYCTGARLVKSSKAKTNHSPPIIPPSPPISEDSVHSTTNQTVSSIHDQDSGYDGYCPGGSSGSADGSPPPSTVQFSSNSLEVSSSENTSLTSSSYEESHYGNMTNSR